MNSTEKIGSPISATFEDFWSNYPRKMSRKAAIRAWNNLTCSDRILAVESLPSHVAYWRACGTEKQFIPYPATWLNGYRFEDELEMPAQKPDTGWMKTEAGIIAEGRRRGIQARPGESIFEFRARIEAAA